MRANEAHAKKEPKAADEDPQADTTRGEFRKWIAIQSNVR